jgi:hypothetical protein
MIAVLSERFASQEADIESKEQNSAYRLTAAFSIAVSDRGLLIG